MENTRFMSDVKTVEMKNLMKVTCLNVKDTNTRDNDARAGLDLRLETNVTAEDEGGDEHEDDKEHGSDGADCCHFWHMMYADLMINRHTDHTGFSKPSARSRLFSCRQELQPCDEGRVGISHSLHSGQVECCVNIHNSLRHGPSSYKCAIITDS